MQYFDEFLKSANAPAKKGVSYGIMRIGPDAYPLFFYNGKRSPYSGEVFFRMARETLSASSFEPEGNGVVSWKEKKSGMFVCADSIAYLYKNGWLKDRSFNKVRGLNKKDEQFILHNFNIIRELHNNVCR